MLVMSAREASKIDGTTGGRADRTLPASHRLAPQHAHGAQGDSTQHAWSAPASFAFMGALIVLALLLAEVLGLFIDLRQP
jgi:hypothetical protein